MTDSTTVKSIPLFSSAPFYDNSVEHDLTKKVEEKNQWLDQTSKVIFFFLRRRAFHDWVLKRSNLQQVIVKSLIFIDQAEKIFHFSDQEFSSWESLCEDLVKQLEDVEIFYAAMGGIIGYHQQCLHLIEEQKQKKASSEHIRYHPPSGIDLSKREVETSWTLRGIKALKAFGELYPVGGAADRLNLQDEKTYLDLPAARLEFLGRTLLEGMIRDVQAKEALYFHLFGEQITIPIALMTSLEKNNHELVGDILSQHQWFGRTREAFFLFSQPLVPTLTQDGSWSLKEPLKLLMKPGGHGALWKLAKEKEVYKWFKQLGKEKILVRQVNNPIAGVDQGLLAFIGVGAYLEKSFGFASCCRRVKTSEGMNIIKEVSKNGTSSSVLSNIEYCDFEKCGIEDVPAKQEEPYSIFPSNTNLLFADLSAIEAATERMPYPGALVNFKKMMIFDPILGSVQAKVARLELLMQNISDAFEVNKEALNHLEDLPSYITFNQRHKTISPTKKEFVPGSGLVETALGCYFDYLKNGYELLSNFCRYEVPEPSSEELFLQEGPSFVFVYHPALGPCYDIIGQKMQGGKLHKGSELQLEIADVSMQSVEIEGSFLVQAKQILGHKVDQKITYSPLTGRCILKNVKVKNKGISQSESNVYWKNKIEREETCYIQLQGYSEFYAENVVLDGDYHVVVKDGERVIALSQGGEVVFKKEALDRKNPSFLYDYQSDDLGNIFLKKNEPTLE